MNNDQLMINKNNHHSFAYIKNANYHSIIKDQSRKERLRVLNTEMWNSSNEFLNHHRKIIKFKTQKSCSVDEMSLKKSRQQAIIDDIVRMDEFSRKYIDRSLQSSKNSLSVNNNRYKQSSIKNTIQQLASLKSNAIYHMAIQNQLKNKINIKNSVQWLNSKNQRPIHYTHVNFFNKKEKIKNFFNSQLSNKQPLSDPHIIFKDNFSQSKKFKHIPKDNIIQKTDTILKKKNKMKDFFKQDDSQETIILIHQNKLQKRQLKLKYRAIKGIISRNGGWQSHLLKEKKIQNDEISPWPQQINEQQQQIL